MNNLQQRSTWCLRGSNRFATVLLGLFLFLLIGTSCRTVTALATCGKPSKAYDGNIETIAARKFDSLQVLPASDLKENLVTVVKELSEYYSQGLDVDLIYYHTCNLTESLRLAPKRQSKMIGTSIRTWERMTGQRKSR